MLSADTPRIYPENADRFYAIAAGRAEVPVIASNEHAIAFDDGSDADKTRISIITREPISSLESLQFGDALRWMGMLDVIRAVPQSMGWGEQEGFRVKLPVHPPYQREPWLRLHLVRSRTKKHAPNAGADGYTRDIGHFAEVAALRRHLDLVFVSDEFVVFHNPEEKDNLKYDHVLMGIPRRHVRTILDPEFTAQDWLLLADGLRQSASRLGIDAYTTYVNVGPPYQHTPWVHVHLMSGGHALPSDDEELGTVGNPAAARDG